jgi:hypothetical protein
LRKGFFEGKNLPQKNLQFKLVKFGFEKVVGYKWLRFLGIGFIYLLAAQIKFPANVS